MNMLKMAGAVVLIVALTLGVLNAQVYPTGKSEPLFKGQKLNGSAAMADQNPSRREKIPARRLLPDIHDCRPDSGRP